MGHHRLPVLPQARPSTCRREGKPGLSERELSAGPGGGRVRGWAPGRCGSVERAWRGAGRGSHTGECPRRWEEAGATARPASGRGRRSPKPAGCVAVILPRLETGRPGASQGDEDSRVGPRVLVPPDPAKSAPAAPCTSRRAPLPPVPPAAAQNRGAPEPTPCRGRDASDSAAVAQPRWVKRPRACERVSAPRSGGGRGGLCSEGADSGREHTAGQKEWLTWKRCPGCRV